MTFDYWKARSERSDAVVRAAMRVSSPFRTEDDERGLAIALDDYARWLREIHPPAAEPSIEAWADAVGIR